MGNHKNSPLKLANSCREILQILKELRQNFENHINKWINFPGKWYSKRSWCFQNSFKFKILQL